MNSFVKNEYRNFLLVFFVVFLLSGLFGNQALALTCTPRLNNCNVGETSVLRLSGLDNAHAELPSESFYTNLICCSEAGVTIGTLDTGGVDSDKFLRLSSATNAHVEKSTFANYLLNDAYISVDTGAITCTYTDGVDCSAGFECLARISDDTNAHIGSCTGSAYSRRVCCSYYIPPTCNFSANPATISPGDSFDFNLLSFTDTTTADINNGVGSVTPTSGTTFNIATGPGATTTYTMTVDGPGGTNTCQTSVTVAPLPTCNLSALPTSIMLGDSSILTWNTSDATSASIDNGIGLVLPIVAGNVNVSPNSPVTYTMTATGAVTSTTCNSSVVSVCGDSSQDGPEACDVAGDIGCAGATPECASDCSSCLSVCGDGLVGGGEACDVAGDVGCAPGWTCNSCILCSTCDYSLTPKFLGKPIKCIIDDISGWLLSIIGKIALLMLIFGGVYYIFSGSDPQKQESAKKMITFALLGLILILISYAILTMLDKIFV